MRSQLSVHNTIECCKKLNYVRLKRATIFAGVRYNYVPKVCHAIAFHFN